MTNESFVKLRKFQIESEKALLNNKSVLIVAPTGLGKTRAAILPFIHGLNENPLLGTRLMYSLPLRALIGGVQKELSEIGNIMPTIHHGDEPESQFFSERAIITTVDQYFTAFAGAPLSWARHHSHSAAAASLLNYSVFDEVHLLSPQRGLQLLFSILYLRNRWGLLSCVMTATLPKSVIEFFKNNAELAVVEASKKDVSARDSWRKVQMELVGEFAGSNFRWERKTPAAIAEMVKDKWENWESIEVDGDRKIIVFVNTVQRAIEVYKRVKSLLNLTNSENVILAHSRFTKKDKKTIVNRIEKFFGKDSEGEAILITTQVAEAGVNISAPLVITELAPIDSLIQRAGRCQRFRPHKKEQLKGLFIVMKPGVKNGDKKDQWYVPYTDSILIKKNKKSQSVRISKVTQKILEKELRKAGDAIDLYWDKENELVNRVLDQIYQIYLQGEKQIDYSEANDVLKEIFDEESKRRNPKNE